MARVVLDHLSKSFHGPGGDIIPAVKNFSLNIEDGELVALVGPSGCGKTTTLRLIAGLENPDSGTISMNGNIVNEFAPKERDVAMVFQNHALYPHMSVYENMAFGLKLRRFPKAEIQQRVNEAAEMLGISDCLTRKPDEISGGQRQRVALGRAIVRRPKVFLLDEPLSNLDAPLRLQMRMELARLHDRLGSTMVYVTHDQMEAMTLGKRVGVMKEGILQQFADPMTLYEQPANMFVASFIGSAPINFFTGTISQTGADLLFRETNSNGEAVPNAFSLPLNGSIASGIRNITGKQIVLGIRPEHIKQKNDATHSAQAAFVTAKADAVVPAGPEVYLQASTGSHSFTARIPTPAKIRPNEKVDLLFDMRFAHLFDPVSQNKIF